MRTERAIATDGLKRQEEVKVVRKMKCGKASEVDWIAVELLKEGGISVINWLLRLFDV